MVLPWAGLKEFRITEVTTNAVEIGAYTTPFFFVMNKDVYGGLPEDVRVVIDEISGETLVAKFPAWWTAWGEAGPGQITDAGGEVITPDAALRQVWVDAISATNAKLEAGLAEDCADGEALVAKVKELASQ